MTKVWIVTSGQYSDCRTDGVFSSKASADAFIAAMYPDDDGDCNGAYEVTLDTCIDKISQGLLVWNVQMRVDGTTDAVRQGGNRQMHHAGYRIRDWGVWEARYLVLDAVVWARDERHAVKIVNEHRAQLIACDAWRLPEAE